MGNNRFDDITDVQHLLQACRESTTAARERLRRSRDTVARSAIRLERAEAACAATERSLRGHRPTSNRTERLIS